MSTTGKARVYRRKPLAVEAIQWTGDNKVNVKDFLGGSFAGTDVMQTRFWVENPIGTQILYKENYVVREADGHCYVVSKVIFEALYDLMGKE